MKRLGPGITIAGIIFLVAASLLFFVGVPLIINDKVTEVSILFKTLNMQPYCDICTMKWYEIILMHGIIVGDAISGGFGYVEQMEGCSYTNSI